VSLPPKDIALGANSDAVFETPIFLSPCLTPPGRAYVIGKTAVDLADDLESGNFEKTANNVIDRVISKGLRKIGVSKTSFVLTSDFETYSSFLNTSTPFKFCSGIFIISYLKGLLFNKLIADSNSRLVLYLLRNGYKCKNNIRIKYKKLYDKNRQEKLAEIKRELSKPPFLRNKYKTGVLPKLLLLVSAKLPSP
jgi:hypothetical protein